MTDQIFNVKSAGVQGGLYLAPISDFTIAGLQREIPDGQWHLLDRMKAANEDDGRPYWMLANACKIDVVCDEGILEFSFKKGWVTDFASVPKRLRGLVGADDPDIQLASLVHDALYGSHALSRNTADILLRDLCKIGGMPTWEAFIVYHAVRLFGQDPWDEADLYVGENQCFTSMEWKPL